MLSERVLSKPPFYFFPAIHYSVESAVELIHAFHELKPDCVAVELPQNCSPEISQAISRLPDLSFISIKRATETVALHIEPCDPFFEAIRIAQEHSTPAHLIDLDVEKYPHFYDPLPDTYAISKIGLKNYWMAVDSNLSSPPPQSIQDTLRETFMAKELKRLSFTYERILVVTGLRHTKGVVAQVGLEKFPESQHARNKEVSLNSYTEECTREIMATCGFITDAYETFRKDPSANFDRNSLHFQLLKEAQKTYEQSSRLTVPPVRILLSLQFARNLALRDGNLLPSLYQLLIAARSCIDHHFAYELYKHATSYPYLKNIENFEEISIDPKTLWGGKAQLKFVIKTPSGKEKPFERLKKDRTRQKYFPLNPQGICSFPPEDRVVEQVGNRLKKRGVLISRDIQSSTIPFSSSLEDGIDIRETIRHWMDKKLYVKKASGKHGESSSCVIIFDSVEIHDTKFPWTMSWLGEHEQESDMAFYATHPLEDIVGPGIARALYGGFLLTSPPRRLYDVWQDPDYAFCTQKEDVLLAAAIDYATKPLVIYVAGKPPSPLLKARAQRQGKQILFIPLTSLSKFELQKIRRFHVLDSHETRKSAQDYIL